MELFKKNTPRAQNYLLFSFDGGWSRFSITPYRDWFLLIVAGVLFGVALASVSLYLFLIFNDNEGIIVESAGSEKTESVYETKLKSALMLFEEKKNTREKLLISPPFIVDPSL